MIIRQYDFIVEGAHESGRKFSQEFLVVAGSEAEALQELRACLDSYEPVDTWRVATGPKVSDLQPGDSAVAKYEVQGAFTVYDPEFSFV